MLEELFTVITYSNALPFIALCIFFYFVKTNPLFDQKQTSLFSNAVLIYLLMIIVISLDYFLTKSTGVNNYIYRRITTFLNFAVSPIIPILLYKIFYKKKTTFVFYIPFIINTIISFLSIFTGYIFFVATNNGYGRGPLFFLPFVTSIIYIMALIFMPKQRYTNAKKVERLYLMLVIVLLAIAMYFEIVLGFYFLTWDYSAICLILYYVMLNIHYSILDPLTNVYNRVKYSKELSFIDHQKNCTLALFDINQFKNINDTLGHEAGDKCLIKFSEILVKHLSSLALIFRIGGDEFTIISRKEGIEKIEIAIQKAKEEAKLSNIYFSHGIKEYYPDQNLQDFLNEVDILMYEDKRKYKEKTLK